MRVLLVGNRVAEKGSRLEGPKTHPMAVSGNPGGRGAGVQESGGSERDSILSLSLSGL